MGLIRKAFAVGTLGRVSYRSKKEIQRRAERALERERKARAAVEARLAVAEERVKRVAAESPDRGHKLSRKGRRTAKRAGRRAKHAVDKAGSVATDAVEHLTHR
jgi:hypothetical protein